jgi:hypothetical protein
MKNIDGKVIQFYNPDDNIQMLIVKVFEQVLKDNEETKEFNTKLVSLI